MPNPKKVISNLISNLKNTCTVLVIAHHVETLKSADKIILLKNGKAEILNDLDNYFQDKSALENDLGLELD
jgi:ABC-type bacteriocin/lantibiotic exporter with double-glycine peptidase domain